ncbi:MAG: hypothetical protein ACREJ3_19290 [Polyangiaceae bacterium]
MKPPAPRFGAQGEVVITGSAYASVFSQQWDSSDASSWGIAFGPQVDWFILRNLSLGFDFEAQYSDSKGYGADGSLVDTRYSLVSGGPKVGYNVTSLW